MHPLEVWRGLPLDKRQALIKTMFHESQPTTDFVEMVKAPAHWGVFASIGPHFQYAIFGRDSIETAEDILATHQLLVRDIILTLAKLQGSNFNPTSEEEPGKVHHEYRRLRFGKQPVPIISQHILERLELIWGTPHDREMIYYGCADSTPLYVRLVGRYVAAYGPTILHESVTRRNGETHTIKESVEQALDWLAEKLINHPLGLHSYKAINPTGLVNQIWKDSPTSHIHITGDLPNFEQPVASLELQGYAYDALLAGIEMQIGAPEKVAFWQHLATHLQEQTIKQLWMPEQHYFAQGLDVDPQTNTPRQIATFTSEAGALLDSRLIHELGAEEAQHYTSKIASRIFAPDFLTNTGIRCRSTTHWDLVDYIDYHGPNVVWPKETFDIAKGLHRSGLHFLASQLERRLQSSFERAGEFYEFFYVSRDGKVWYDRNLALHHFEAESHGRHTPKPERGQAWTIAAATHIARSRQNTTDITPTATEKQIAKHIETAAL